MHNYRIMRKLAVLGAALTVAVLAACGGGGGGGGGSSSTTSASGSGSGSQSNAAPASNTPNQVALSVSAGVNNGVNMPTTSVQVCAPGGGACQTIANVLVDTGSYGLRLVSSAASSVLGSLPAQTSGGATLAECGQFVSSYTWGSVRLATVSLAGETAKSIPIQIMGDLGTSNVPSACSNGLTQINTAQQLGANGILGVGVAPNDCGVTCATMASSSTYYACSGSTCNQTTVPQSQQVQSVVRSFASDNNGVVIALNNPSGGTASGTMTFGINTQSDNTLGSSPAKLQTDGAGDLGGALAGTIYNTTFFDTGSNGYFFDAPSGVALTPCSDNKQFYCPSASQAMSGTVTGLNGAQAALGVTIQNADALFATRNSALPNLGGPLDQSGQTKFADVLDLGLPFFYGRTVYLGLDLTGSGGAAPYVAF